MKPRPLPLIVIMLFALCAVLMSQGSSPVAAAAAAAPLPAATEGAPPPAESLPELAQRVLDEYYGLLEAEEKSDVDGQLELLDSTAGSAREVSSTAVMLSATASSEHMPIVLAAAAARHAPDDALVVNNFGAMLRRANLLDESIVALLHALELEPSSPAILTNLGNSYLDKGLNGDAQLAFTMALAFDGDFDAAHYGMSIVWNRRGNGKMAVEHLAKAARTGFVPSMRQVFIGARSAGGSVTRPFWDVIIDEPQSQNDDGPEGPGDDGDTPQGDRLILPTLPKWNDRMSFLASAPSYVRLSQQIMDKGLIGGLAFAAQYYGDEFGGDEADHDEFDDDWSDEGDWDDDWGDDDWGADGDELSAQSEPQQPIYQQKLFMLELVNDYYSGRIADELNESAARRKEIDDRYESEMEELREGGMMNNLELLIAANKVFEAKALAQQVNGLSGQIADTHFYAWRDLTLSSYGNLRSLLQEYWRVSDEMTAGIYDQSVMDFVNQVRELTVYASLLPLSLDLSTLPQSYTLADYIAPITAEGEDLSQYRPQPMGELTVPQKRAQECGLKGKLSFSLGPASFSVTCDSWELEYLSGVGGSYKQNFKTGESEISILVGAKAGVGVGPASGELSAKGGLTFRFDSDGDFSGWGDKGGLEAKAGIGPLSAGQSMEATGYLTAVTGPRVETSSSYGFGN